MSTDLITRLLNTGTNNPPSWETAREAADYITALEAKLATAREALEKIDDTNASKHGTIGMMLNRCTTIAREALAALGDAQPASADWMIAAVDAAMVEMKNIHPPLKRSECERLIRAAMGYATPKPASAEVKPVADDVRGVISRLQSFLDRVIQHSGDGTIHPELYEGDCDTLRDAITHLRHADRAPTPPQQPRQESEIAAEALEEAADTIDKWDAQARIIAKWLRERAAKKREQAK